MTRKLGKAMLYGRHDKQGYLQEVRNPKGKKPAVYIYQGMTPGFSASYAKKPYRRIKGYRMNAEKYAEELAYRGHKRITFRD